MELCYFHYLYLRVCVPSVCLNCERLAIESCNFIYRFQIIDTGNQFFLFCVLFFISQKALVVVGTLKFLSRLV